MTKFMIYQRRLFMLLMVCLPFNHLPISIPLLGQQPSVGFLFLGYILLIAEYFVSDMKLDKYERRIGIFLIVSFLWALLSRIVGVIDYQYYEYINFGQIDNLENLYINLSGLIDLDELTTIKSWLMVMSIKSAGLLIIYTYAISFWVYHIYRRNWKIAFDDLRKILLILCIILILYSTFELNYLLGGSLGESVLKTINPLYMKVADIHGWWPPLLWNGQLRSLFAEPSFFGIFEAMTIPIMISFFWAKRMNLKIFLGIAVYICLVIMLVLSKARTANILFIIELICLFSMFIFFHYQSWKKICLISVITMISFLIGVGLTSNFVHDDNIHHERVSVETYMSQNVASVIGNKRSNSVRMANVLV